MLLLHHIRSGPNASRPNEEGQWSRLDLCRPIRSESWDSRVHAVMPTAVSVLTRLVPEEGCGGHSHAGAWTEPIPRASTFDLHAHTRLDMRWNEEVDIKIRSKYMASFMPLDIVPLVWALCCPDKGRLTWNFTQLQTHCPRMFSSCLADCSGMDGSLASVYYVFFWRWIHVHMREVTKTLCPIINVIDGATRTRCYFPPFTTERARSFCDFWTTPGPSAVYSPKLFVPDGYLLCFSLKFIISSARQTVTPRGAINRSFYTRIGILLLLPFSSTSCLPRPAYHASSCNPAVRLRSSEPVSPPPRTAKVKKHLTPPSLSVLPARRFLADIPLAILSRSSHS